MKIYPEYEETHDDLPFHTIKSTVVVERGDYKWEQDVVSTARIDPLKSRYLQVEENKLRFEMEVGRLLMHGLYSVTPIIDAQYGTPIQRLISCKSNQ